LPDCSNRSLRLVTAYVPLDCDNRSEGAYHELGRELQSLRLPLTVFHQTLAETWLAEHYESVGCPVRSGGKDSLAYHCVQHEKSRWLLRAMRGWPSETVAWIDYGILHNPKIKPADVLAWVRAVSESPPSKITAPSCQPLHASPDEAINWSLCGGLIAMPARNVLWFHDKCQLYAKTGDPTWEVNTWAKVAIERAEMFCLYPANHDQTMFHNYPVAA